MNPEHTYGANPAAMHLHDIVSRHGKVAQRRVGRFLCRYNHLLGLIPFEDTTSAATLYALIRDDAIRAAKVSHHFVPFQSHLLNVLVGRYRDYTRRLKS